MPDGAAHLPGMLAAKTHLPVIGVPIPTEHLRGLDSLLSIVQMPKGIPVATVAIGGAENAGLLAAQILAGRYAWIAERVKAFADELRRKASSILRKLKEQVSAISARINRADSRDSEDPGTGIHARRSRRRAAGSHVCTGQPGAWVTTSRSGIRILTRLRIGWRAAPFPRRFRIPLPAKISPRWFTP